MPHLAGLQSLTYRNGLALSLNYDGDGRLTDMRAADGTTEVQDLTLTYDASANITAITDNLDPARSQTFGYDGVDRLTHACGPYGAIDYTYDLVGNRSHRTIDDGTLTDEVYAYSAGSHRLASLTVGSAVRDFGYTAAGSTSSDTRSGTTLAFTYNHSGRLTSVTAQAGPLASREYWYDALEHRVHEIREDRVGQGIDTAEFSYVYDLSGHLLAEYATDGLVPQVLREYIWLDDTPVALIDHTGAGDAQLLAIHTDHLRRPQKLTDASQALVWDGQFDPFGEEYAVASTTDMPLRFPGQEWDAATALSQNWNRDYDPTLGRYIESDPIGLMGGVNRYAYVESNPMYWADPTGLYHCVGNASCRGFTPNLTDALQCFDKCTALDTGITCGTDSHDAEDPHSEGQGADVGRNTNPGVTRSAAERCYSDCFDVATSYAQEEQNAGPGTHFHFQTRPGLGGITGFRPGVQPRKKQRVIP
ncbi:MAG: hypothetical protein HY899_15085 [Deltaproteobacteria bacterium]|nr:hypothetical protein [Deltaproteobacteria bacterium]